MRETASGASLGVNSRGSVFRKPKFLQKTQNGLHFIRADVNIRTTGKAVHTDTTVASGQAYLNAVNRYLMTKDVAVFAGADVTTP